MAPIAQNGPFWAQKSCFFLYKQQKLSGAVIVRMGQAKVEHTGEYKLTADNGHGRDEVRFVKLGIEFSFCFEVFGLFFTSFLADYSFDILHRR